MYQARFLTLQTTVYVNGATVGNHTGGYDGFAFDITSNLRPTANELIVFVYDPSDFGPQVQYSRLSFSLFLSFQPSPLPFFSFSLSLSLSLSLTLSFYSRFIRTLYA